MMNPALISALIQLGPAAYQMIQGIKQTREGKEMQKNLGARVNYEIPQEAKQALGLMQQLASSREMPGQASMQSMMDLQTQRAFGNASRAATSSQDLLGVATNLGEQAQENQLNLGIQAAQNYQQRQQDLYGALGNMAGYQEKKIADRQQDWYERSAAAAAMRGAGMQNTLGGIQGATNVAASAIANGALDGLFKGGKGKSIQKTLGSMNAITGSEDDAFVNPTGYIAPGMSSQQMIGVTGMNNSGGWNYMQPPTSPYKSPYMSMTQQIGQQAYGNDWQNFLNTLNFQQTPQ